MEHLSDVANVLEFRLLWLWQTTSQQQANDVRQAALFANTGLALFRPVPLPQMYHREKPGPA